MITNNNFTHRTIPEIAREAAQKWPGKVAIKYDGGELTYSEQYHNICCVAKGLRSLGIKKGDHVATLMGGCPEWFYVSYAITLVGAVIVPINVTFRHQELAHILKSADAKALITVDSFRGTDYIDLISELIPELKNSKPGFLNSHQFPRLETIISINSDNNEKDGCFDLMDMMRSGQRYQVDEVNTWHQQIKPEDTSYILFTSGSTAFPKPAMRTHGSNVGIAHHIYSASFQLGPTDTVLGLSPFYHVGGCIYTTLGTALAGARLILMPFFEPGEALRLIKDEQITCLGGFDTHYRAMSRHPSFNPSDVSSVTKISLACGPEWYDKVKELGFGSKSVTHHYGFTEGTSVVMPPGENDDSIRKNSNGKPFPGMDVKIKNPETGVECAANEPGEICVRGWSLFQGYYKMPKDTAKSFDQEGFFHSGDYGWKDEHGYIYYRGRYKQMVKTGGENVSEREVEMFLEQHPMISNIQIVGVPDEKWGEAVTAIVEPKPGVNLTPEELKAFCKGKISGFKIPKHLMMISHTDWPITMTGKYDKVTLRKMAMEWLNIVE